MRTRRWLPAVAAAVVAGAGTARPAEAQRTFVATLTTGQETSAVGLTTAGTNTAPTGLPRPTPVGSALFTLNEAQTQLSMTATILNIDFGALLGTGPQTSYTTDDQVNAHIHCCQPPGTAAGVVWGFIGNPFHNTAPGNTTVISALPGGGVGAVVTAIWDASEGANGGLAGNLPGILAGNAYVNFHTVQNPGGEIRGQILATPEPSAVALLATGVGMFGLVGWRRRRNAV